MENLVSIIIPCYNIENYIIKCLNSIVLQDYRPIEIVLIDDVSIDNTVEVIENYISNLKDDLKKGINFILIKLTKNSGSAIARNEGLKIVSGKYLMFVDGDDWIYDKTLSTCIPLISSQNVDLLEFRYKRVNSHQPVFSSNVITDFKIIIGKEKIESLTDHLMWNKIYLTQIIKDNALSFKFRRFQDTLFTREYSILCNKAIFINNIFYYYFVNNNSVMRTLDIQKISKLEATDAVIKFYDDNFMIKQKMKFIKKSRQFIITRLIRYSHFSNEKFYFDNDNSEVAKYCYNLIKLYNKSKFLFRLRSYLIIKPKISIKQIIKYGL